MCRQRQDTQIVVHYKELGIKDAGIIDTQTLCMCSGGTDIYWLGNRWYECDIKMSKNRLYSYYFNT